MDASPDPDWRLGLGAAMRYHNVQNIQKSIENAGEVSKGKAQSEAFAAEIEAYNKAISRAAYDTICKALAAAESQSEATTITTISTLSSHSPVTIGPYKNCQHISSGFISEVYKSDSFALKVITETRDIQPHNPAREVKILKELSHPSVIKLIETSKDEDGRLILVFPYMPLTLANLLSSQQQPSKTDTISHSHDLFSALSYLHAHAIIHRDVKPSNLLLTSPSGPAHLADFGTAWHPILSLPDEPPDNKILDIGTTCYRAPETLFGNHAYGPGVDIWAAGTMLAECVRTPPTSLFTSREAHEDGNQLGLILSMFKTLGTPTRESWPEAEHFSTPPFECYQVFEGKGWEELLPGVEEEWRDLVKALVCYESGGRLTAKEALERLEAMKSAASQ